MHVFVDFILIFTNKVYAVKLFSYLNQARSSYCLRSQLTKYRQIYGLTVSVVTSGNLKTIATVIHQAISTGIQSSRFFHDP